MAKKIISIIFVIILIIPAVQVLTGEDKNFSDNENRYLQQCPKLNVASLLSGTFQRESEDYISDQFILRDEFMKAASSIKTFMGRKDLQGVYIGKDGHLFEKILDRDIDKKQFEANLNRIDNLADESGLHSSLILVPDSGTILKDYLPDNAKMYDTDSLYALTADTLDSIDVVNPSKVLSDLGGKAYYKSDHHWTTEGAYEAYKMYTKGSGDYDINTLSLRDVTKDFLGSLYSKTLLPNAAFDTIEIPVVEDESIYDYTALDRKDKYQIFFGGNEGIRQIKGTGRGNLLVIKDSFANCMVPFLTKDYENITMIDLRYFPGSVRDFISQNDFNDMLILYGLSNFAGSPDLVKLAL